MGILLYLMLILAFAAPPLLSLAAFVYFFSSYRKMKTDAPELRVSHRGKRYQYLAILFGVVFLAFTALSVFYAVLIFSGNILM